MPGPAFEAYVPASRGSRYSMLTVREEIFRTTGIFRLKADPTTRRSTARKSASGTPAAIRSSGRRPQSSHW